MHLIRVTILVLIVLISKLATAQEPGTPPAPSTPTTRALEKAEKLFKEQNWAEARAAYDEARDLEKDWRAAPVRLAVEGAVAASLKLQQWDDAIARAQEFVAKTKGSFEEAVGERFLAGLYLAVPHYGTKRGSTYLRGQHTQGVQVSSWRKDSREAIAHYERARELLIVLSNQRALRTAEFERLLRAERIGVNFDLAGTLARKTGYGYGYGYNRWGWLGWWWASWLEPEEDSAAVEEADYEEARWGRYGYQEEQETPTGIPLGPDAMVVPGA